MAPLTPMDIYKLLEKSNCAKCGLPTCMAFAASVIAGEVSIEACPRLDPAEAQRLAPRIDKRLSEEGFRASVKELRQQFRSLDLASLTTRLGATYGGEHLSIECLGKEFVLNPQGMLESRCHVNIWMETLLLIYCQSAGDGNLSGQWVSFGQLNGGKTTAPYFDRRCQEPLHALADAHDGIFFDLLKVFGSTRAEGFMAHRAVLLRPLPKVPMVILYSPSEEGMESSLSVLFDTSATGYIGPEVLTYMVRGIVEMLQRIITRHEGCLPDLLSL